MSTVEDYIESGILEQYALGQTSAEESAEVERQAAVHPAIQTALDEITSSLEAYAMANAVEPPVTIKPFLLAVIDYIARLQQGEQPAQPPQLQKGVSPSDFSEWTSRPDMVAPEKLDGLYAKIIAHSPAETTAIVWIEAMAPEELHHDEHEKFLILEGTCDIQIGESVHSLKAGDFLSIPLHVAHEVRVTSSTPCKVILQRTAA